MNRIWGRAFAWLLCLALILGLSAPALAEELAASDPPAETPVTTAAPIPESSILDTAALTKMVEDYLAGKGIPKDRVGIGYCYTATGDEWFYNGDTWFYPGSMYKVPLMMDLAERIRKGEVADGTQIGGLDIDTVFEYILVYSNNDYAHKVRTYLGGDETWREEVKQYAGLDSYDERYMLYCYFSPRYMTRVMETLFREQERFPKVMDNLLQAEQGHYFRLPDEMHPYDVAQKYGSYIDNENSNWNHTTGIVYTPNPFIITVMTKNVGGSEAVIGQLGALFKDYTLELDQTLEAYRQEQAQLEAELRAQEEAERLAAEQAQNPQSAVPQSTPRPSQPQPQLQTTTPDRAERGHRAGIIVLLILLGAAILGGVASVIIVKENERRRYESYKRRFEEEMRQEMLEREQAARRSAPAAQPRQRPAQSAPVSRPVQRAQRPARSENAPETQQRRQEAPVREARPIRPQPQQTAPMDFDEEQWLHDEEDE